MFSEMEVQTLRFLPCFSCSCARSKSNSLWSGEWQLARKIHYYRDAVLRDVSPDEVPQRISFTALMRTTANSMLGNQHATIKDLELKTNASFWEMLTTELLPSDSNSVWQFF